MRRFLTLFLAVVLTVITAGSTKAFAQDTKAQETKKARLQKEIALLDSQIKAIATKSANAVNQLALIRKKVDARKELGHQQLYILKRKRHQANERTS